MPKNLTAADIPFIVKVCGITTEEALEASVEAGANAIGFNFYSKSPRFLTAARARRLVQFLSADYLKVGVFVNPSENEVLDIALHVPLDVVQLHGDQSPFQLANSMRVWRGAHATIDRNFLSSEVEAWLLDTPTPQHGGSGKTFDWSLAAGFPRRAIVAGGLDGDNVGEAIRAATPWGVDACSRLEAKPGEKDRARIERFVEAARCAFQSQLKLHSEMHS